MTKRYYWLKLQEDFLKDKRLKKLRKIAGGDTFAFIYLEMILNTLNTEGVIIYEGIEDTVAKEVALELDEDPDSVQITISYLMNVGLMVDLGDGRFLLPYVAENTGSEGASAKRMRDLRERKKASQCDTVVTPLLQTSDGEIEIEKDIEKEKDYLKDIKSDKPTSSLPKKKRSQFVKPTIEELEVYIKSNNYSFVDAVAFMNYYDDHDWMCNKAPMRNWKNAVYAWNKNQKRWREEKAAAPKNDKNSFMQNDYDFDALEKQLVRN